MHGINIMVTFASTHAIDVEIWQDVEDASHPQLVWREGTNGGSPIRLLRTAQHYDLILKRRLRQKTGGAPEWKSFGDHTKGGGWDPGSGLIYTLNHPVLFIAQMDPVWGFAGQGPVGDSVMFFWWKIYILCPGVVFYFKSWKKTVRQKNKTCQRRCSMIKAPYIGYGYPTFYRESGNPYTGSIIKPLLLGWCPSPTSGPLWIFVIVAKMTKCEIYAVELENAVPAVKSQVLQKQNLELQSQRSLFFSEPGNRVTDSGALGIQSPNVRGWLGCLVTETKRKGHLGSMKPFSVSVIGSLGVVEAILNAKRSMWVIGHPCDKMAWYGWDWWV